jgi:hypothetical protein
MNKRLPHRLPSIPVPVSRPGKSWWVAVGSANDPNHRGLSLSNPSSIAPEKRRILRPVRRLPAAASWDWRLRTEISHGSNAQKIRGGIMAHLLRSVKLPQQTRAGVIISEGRLTRRIPTLLAAAEEAHNPF